MADLDFVDLSKLDSSIVLDIRYATTNNFCNQIIYTSPKCFLRRQVALKLLPIQKSLQKSGYGLKVFDGYRPLSAQRRLFEVCPDPNFVADPKIGSKHNRGAAIDLTLVDADGQELDMPTLFDEFSKKAHRSFSELPQHILENRKRLEDAMMSEGFLPLPHEWWHFDDAEWEQYPVMDLSFEELEQTCVV